MRAAPSCRQGPLRSSSGWMVITCSSPIVFAGTQRSARVSSFSSCTWLWCGGMHACLQFVLSSSPSLLSCCSCLISECGCVCCVFSLYLICGGRVSRAKCGGSSEVGGSDGELQERVGREGWGSLLRRHPGKRRRDGKFEDSLPLGLDSKLETFRFPLAATPWSHSSCGSSLL